MKVENSSRTSLVQIVLKSVRDYRARQNQMYLEYRQAYKSCFEGTKAEVEMKCAIWDEVHRITRQSNGYRGLF